MSMCCPSRSEFGKAVSPPNGSTRPIRRGRSHPLRKSNREAAGGTPAIECLDVARRGRSAATEGAQGRAVGSSAAELARQREHVEAMSAGTRGQPGPVRAVGKRPAGPSSRLRRRSGRLQRRSHGARPDRRVMRSALPLGRGRHSRANRRDVADRARRDAEERGRVRLDGHSIGGRARRDPHGGDGAIPGRLTRRAERPAATSRPRCRISPFADDALRSRACARISCFSTPRSVDREFHRAAVPRTVPRRPTRFAFFRCSRSAAGARITWRVCSDVLRAAGHDVAVERVPYEFQRGGNEMLRIRRGGR